MRGASPAVYELRGLASPSVTAHHRHRGRDVVDNRSGGADAEADAEIRASSRTLTSEDTIPHCSRAAPPTWHLMQPQHQCAAVGDGKRSDLDLPVRIPSRISRDHQKDPHRMEQGTLQMEYSTSTYHGIPMIPKSPVASSCVNYIDLEDDTTIGGVIKSGPRRARLPHRRVTSGRTGARQSGRG
jgi:hypothetical protein